MFGSADLPGIPLVGSAIGIRSFDPERDIELTDLDMAEVLYHLRRPMSLADDGKAYALTVIGDSMAPKYDPGTRVIVSPKATVQIRDYVVVQLKSEDAEDQYEERVTSVLIKRLVRRSASFIELMQFNPETTFRVGTERIAAIHKVIGEAY
jgi:phage repressor protein C with HTH and peptisase S24 domain